MTQDEWDRASPEKRVLHQFLAAMAETSHHSGRRMREAILELVADLPAELRTVHPDALPSLPRVLYERAEDQKPWYAADQMHEYARQAVLMDRESRPLAQGSQARDGDGSPGRSWARPDEQELNPGLS